MLLLFLLNAMFVLLVTFLLLVLVLLLIRLRAYESATGCVRQIKNIHPNFKYSCLRRIALDKLLITYEGTLFKIKMSYGAPHRLPE